MAIAHMGPEVNGQVGACPQYSPSTARRMYLISVLFCFYLRFCLYITNMLATKAPRPLDTDRGGSVSRSSDVVLIEGDCMTMT